MRQLELKLIKLSDAITAV